MVIGEPIATLIFVEDQPSSPTNQPRRTLGSKSSSTLARKNSGKKSESKAASSVRVANKESLIGMGGIQRYKSRQSSERSPAKQFWDYLFYDDSDDDNGHNIAFK